MMMMMMMMTMAAETRLLEAFRSGTTIDNGQICVSQSKFEPGLMLIGTLEYEV